MAKRGNLLSNIFKLEEQSQEIIQDKEDKVESLHIMPIGVTGTESYSGYPSEEYFNDLRGKSKADIYDEMRRSDSNIKMCLSAVKNPIIAGTWSIEPANDSPEAEKKAKLLEKIIFKELDRPFKKKLEEILTFVDFGHSVFEIQHKIMQNDKDFGDYIGIASLGFRSQRTIDRWNLEDKTGKLLSITQISNGDLDVYTDIPAKFLVVFNINQEGSNYEGVSLLRQCYGPWKRKDINLKINSIGIEKFAIPTIIAQYDGQPSDSELTKLAQMLQAYVANENNFLILPSSIKVIIQANPYDPEKVDATIDKEDSRMVKAFLANFLELGMNTVGSYALSNDLSDFFLSGVEAIADVVTDAFNNEIIPHLNKLNFADDLNLPQLKVSGISDKAGEELAQVMRYLVDAQILTPDDKLEDDVRERYNLPKRSNQGVRKIQNVPGNFSELTLQEKIKEKYNKLRLKLDEKKKP